MPKNPMLEELLRDAKPVNWDELNRHIPDWTPEERIENEAWLRELELERLPRFERQKIRDAELLESFTSISEIPE
jgi:hypothetical protein